MILQSNDKPATSIIKATATFTIATPVTLEIWQNNNGEHIPAIGMNKFSTGKYAINNYQRLWTIGKTIIHPSISESSSIPLSKTTWGDYNYHFIQLGVDTIHLFCQLTATAAYVDFTDIFDGIKIPIHIESNNF